MAKAMYYAVNNVVRKVKKIFYSVDGKARKVKKVYIGVNGVAKLAWQNGINYLFSGGGTGALEVTNENDYTTMKQLAAGESSNKAGVNFIRNLNNEIVISRGTYTFYKFNPLDSSLISLTQPVRGHSIYDMCYGNGYYLCITYDWDENSYEYYYGTTLNTWKDGSYYFGNTRLKEVDYSNGNFYITTGPFNTGGRHDIWRFSNTPNGSMTIATVSTSSSFSYRTFWIYNGYIAVSSSDSIYYTSENSDMSVWNSVYTGFGLKEKVVVGKDRLIGVNSNDRVCYSMDGLNWAVTAKTAYQISYSEGIYYCIDTKKIVYKSTDLVTWTQIATMTVSASKFLAVSLDG